MLVQALAAFADNYLADQMEDPAFERKPVLLELEIANDGRFLGWISREEQVQQGKKTVMRPRMAEVPKSPVNRNSGVHPLLAYDDAKYVFGPGPWTKEKQQEDHAAKHAGFVDLLRRAAVETKDDALMACVAFYNSPAEVDRARAGFDERLTGGILLAVSPDGPVIRRPSAKAFWRSHYRDRLGVRNEAGGSGMCLVAGTWGAVAPTHDKIKGAASLGGQAAGVALMSFDKDAFRSYGWDKCANSPVSPDRAQAYVMALNHLMSSRDRHRVDRNGTGFLFWLRKPSEFEPVGMLEKAEPDQVRRLISLRNEGWDFLEPNDFYLVAVRGNGGRLLVSQWIHESLHIVLEHVAQWFEGLQMVDCFTGETGVPPKMWQLLATLAREDPPAAAALELTRRALLGQPVGLSLLHAALTRMRLEQGKAKLNTARAGLIRLLVNDEIEKSGGTKMNRELNAGEEHPAYLCGRLLAQFDSLQYLASQTDLNQTVADRYYSLASTQPRLAFPKLEDLGLKHLRKVRRENMGAAISIERQMDEIRKAVGTVFPEAFSLVEQGRFALGFHHERAAILQRAKEAKEKRLQKDQQGETK